MRALKTIWRWLREAGEQIRHGNSDVGRLPHIPIDIPMPVVKPARTRSRWPGPQGFDAQPARDAAERILTRAAEGATYYLHEATCTTTPAITWGPTTRTA